MDRSQQAPHYDVLYEVTDKVARITLNAPERLNALDENTYGALLAALDEFEGDEEARVAVLSGTGTSFCAGANLKSLSETAPASSLWERRARIRSHAELWIRIWDHPKPIIAQVHGHCLGAGVLLAASCDITIVARDAVIGWPKLPVGGGYISHMVSWHIGPKRAKEMSFIAGSTIDGKTAAEWGLANRAVDPDTLGDEVAQMAAQISLMPNSLLELKKRSINSVFNHAGYREEVLQSADRDAMSHEDPGVLKARDWIKTDGFKSAQQRYEHFGV